MRYRQLGRTGLSVSEIGHGLWGMSGWSGSEDPQSREALRLSAELGCNFYDSAWVYGEGKSDRLLGELLAAHARLRPISSRTSEEAFRAERSLRERPGRAAAMLDEQEIEQGIETFGKLHRGIRELIARAGWRQAFSSVLHAASKVPPKNRRWPAGADDGYEDVFPARHVFAHASKIRRKLGVKTIDLLQFHVWEDRWVDEPEFRRTVEKLKGDGVIRFFGLSLNRWQPENGIAALRTGLVDTVQVIYNIFDQAPEDRLFPVCRELNIGVIARVPLDEGGLSGKLTPETEFPEGDWRARYFNAANLQETVARAERLKRILPPGMTLPEMSLRFILSNPAVSTTIPGMRKPGHVRANLAASDAGPLDDALLAELKKHRWNRPPAL